MMTGAPVHEAVGILSILDATDIKVNLRDLVSLTAQMREAALKSGATVENITITPFEKDAYSIVLTLSESHLTVHCYPDEHTAFFDMFTCGRTCQPAVGLQALKDWLECKGGIVTIYRGNFSE